MEGRNELQQKIADIGDRYIRRTAGELAGLRDLIGNARLGNARALKDIEQLAHKIYGSGSMFGFEAVSEQAHLLELAARDVTDPAVLDKVQQHAAGLEQHVQAALRARGLG